MFKDSDIAKLQALGFTPTQRPKKPLTSVCLWVETLGMQKSHKTGVVYACLTRKPFLGMPKQKDVKFVPNKDCRTVRIVGEPFFTARPRELVRFNAGDAAAVLH